MFWVKRPGFGCKVSQCHAQNTLASKMATIVPTSYRKTAKKCPDVSVEILVFVGRRQLQNVLTSS